MNDFLTQAFDEKRNEIHLVLFLLVVEFFELFLVEGISDVLFNPIFIVDDLPLRHCCWQQRTCQIFQFVTVTPYILVGCLWGVHKSLNDFLCLDSIPSFELFQQFLEGEKHVFFFVGLKMRQGIAFKSLEQNCLHFGVLVVGICCHNVQFKLEHFPCVMVVCAIEWCDSVS